MAVDNSPSEILRLNKGWITAIAAIATIIAVTSSQLTSCFEGRSTAEGHFSSIDTHLGNLDNSFKLLSDQVSSDHDYIVGKKAIEEEQDKELQATIDEAKKKQKIIEAHAAKRRRAEEAEQSDSDYRRQ